MTVERIDFESSVYPGKLKSILDRGAPRQIFAAGNIGLLEKDGIGFCGSRAVSPEGLSAAKECAEVCVENGLVAVSGGAKGVDRAVHAGALSRGGGTIIVLAEGIGRFRIPRELRDVWDWERVLILSQFPEESIWRAYQAMERNRVIIGLSLSMVVIESGPEGGTWNAALDALKLQVPLFVVEYRDPQPEQRANDLLIQKGGHPIRRSRETGLPNLRRILHEAAQFKNDLHLNVHNRRLL